MNDEEKQTDKLMEENLKVYCSTEPDINMLTLAFYLFSQRLEYFRFGREFINPTLELLAERLIKERMTECDPIHNIDESIFSNMILFKDEFATKEQWETKFEQFICEDENRCMRWLCSMVSFYSNGRIEWNYRHHEAIIGEYTNSGDHLYERIKQKFPNHIDIVDELIHFQNYGSLKDLTLTACVRVRPLPPHTLHHPSAIIHHPFHQLFFNLTKVHTFPYPMNPPKPKSIKYPAIPI